MGNLYTKMKLFHFKEKLDSLPLETGEVLPPLHMRIKPTNACNHRCRYCAYRAEELQLGKDMKIADSLPGEKMLELMDDVIEMGVKAVTFSGGGEPLFYPYLGEAVKKLVDSDVRFATLTNGALLKGEVADLFANHGSWVRISMDGWDNASYTQYRMVPDGEYDRIMENIESFQKIGGPCLLGVSYIVDKQNAPHVYDAVRRIKDMGANSVKVSPCIVDNEGAKNNAYHEPIFEQVREQVDRAKADLENGDFEIFDAYHVLDHRFEKKYRWCPYLQVLPVVGADMNVYSCQDKAYNLESGLLGSIADRRFKDFWMDGKEKFFAIDPSRECNHHCVANGKNRLVLEYLDADPDHLGFV